MFLNIYSKGKYPANELSNFAAHEFDFQGFEKIPSMESFLQSLKYSDIDEQIHVLYLNARDAKKTGTNMKWHRYLYWNNCVYDRNSKEYIKLIEQAYRALLSNDNFKKALIDSKGKILIHTIGKIRRSKTVLTSWEFCYILWKLRRQELKKEDSNE